MTKKYLLGLLVLLLSGLLFACGETTNTQTTSSNLETILTTSAAPPTTETPTTEATTEATTEDSYVYSAISVPDYVLEEERLSFKYFWEVVNGDPQSSGYGMVSDRYNTVTKTAGAASIASVGFGLAAVPIGIENDWISYNEGYERVLGTLRTIDNMQTTHGFYYHFVDMDQAMRSGNSEVSIIDTAIMICGVLMAGEYFGGEIKILGESIYQKVEWDWYYSDNANMFYMGYTPENGFSGYWNGYAEQLMLYILAAASDYYPVGKEAYDQMKLSSQRKQYGSSDYFYTSYPGTLFTYQYSHAFFDFRTALDEDNDNWFNNSIQASIAARDYGILQSVNYKTYSDVSWGNTACDGPDGYKAYGNLPAIGTIQIDGTLAPSGAIGSIVFVPELVLPTFEYFESITSLHSKYGYLDSFNLGLTETASEFIIRPNRPIPVDGWFSTDVIGIDKGITLLMIENYRSGFVWDIFMQSEIVQEGYDLIGFTILGD
ncbi:glucoamylase family protein [Candidatus Izemoplasma sp. B36]|uniref:glucoamylase family protein n=1 Tax=Candidatus Izemoplasma sp. B36 TaxID=3242468 RepID=UPI00355830B2